MVFACSEGRQPLTLRLVGGSPRGCVCPPPPSGLCPVLAHLNLTFMKVDLLAFGGGFTTIPLIQREVVDRFGWVSTREFIDGIALGQVTPGPIVITATFVGYKAAASWVRSWERSPSFFLPS